MRYSRHGLAVGLPLMLIGLAGCGSDSNSSPVAGDNAETPDTTIELTRVGRSAPQGFDVSAAEIVAFDAVNRQIFSTSGKVRAVNVYNAADGAAIRGLNTPALTLDIPTLLVSNSVVADPALVGDVTSVDPEGSVSLVTVSDFSAVSVGFSDFNSGNTLDASQKDGVNLKNWPVMGMYMPDSIAAFTVAGVDYVVTANEGDDRQDWLDGVSDRPTCETAGYFFDTANNVCVDAFSAKDYYAADNVTLTSALTSATNGGFGEDDELRRLKFSYVTTVRKNGGTDFTTLYAYGGRSFSIWNMATGDLGPEGFKFVPADHSPTGKALLIVGNEVSGNTSVYEIASVNKP